MSSLVQAALAAGLLLGLHGSLGAQIPDSTRADSAAVSDTTDSSELFLRSYEEGRNRVPVHPRLGRPEMLPAGTRIVIDRDSLEWHTAQSVSDLLTRVPGTYLWRGGWIGRPEPVVYQGRGAASTEFLIDGMPVIPLGPDSLGVDPSLLALSFFDRVEVERLPGLLRVHLFTRQHDRLPPRTRVGVSSGDFDIARYIASLEKRTRGGFGFALAADHLAVPLRSGDQGGYSNTQGLLQATYVPPESPWRAMVQLLLNNPQRKTVRAVNDAGALQPDTLSQGLLGSRSDLQLSLLYQPDPTGLGLSAGLLASRSSWREDSTEIALGSPDGHILWVDQAVSQIGVHATYRTRTTSLNGLARYRSRWTPGEVRAGASVSPRDGVVASVEAVGQQHSGARTSRWLLGRAGVALPFGGRVAVQGRVGSWVDLPSLETRQADSRVDAGLLIGIDRPRFAVEAGYWRTDQFAPEPFPLYRGIDSLLPLGSTRWLTVSARVAPLQWFVLDGWYSNPVGTAPQGIPPTHSIINATVQSRYLPTFRSGIFALRLRGTVENWGTSVLGLDPAGDPLTLKGATFVRAQIQLQIGSFIAYYDRANTQASRLGYLPGLPQLRLASSFGVRWEFSN